MWIKICGLMNKEAIEAAVASGATHVGFVFAPSKRMLTLKEAQFLAEAVPEGVQKVGLFVDESLDVVNATIKAVGLDMVQLHGDESPAYVAAVSVPVIKVFAIKNGQIPATIKDYKDVILLFDAPASEFAGGNGKRFDWEKLALDTLFGRKFFVAGGLNSENVKAAIELLQPTGVDVSSGVETKGVKDVAKIKAFIENAKSTQI
jgi:phosphoribosylanthranilate isomerase